MASPILETKLLIALDHRPRTLPWTVYHHSYDTRRTDARILGDEGPATDAAPKGRGPGARDTADGRGGALLRRRPHPDQRHPGGARQDLARAPRRPRAPLRARSRRRRRT